MKSKDLAQELLKNPDFDIEFVFGGKDESKWGYLRRVFENVEIVDIGYSSKKILLGGEEK